MILILYIIIYYSTLYNIIYRKSVFGLFLALFKVVKSLIF